MKNIHFIAGLPRSGSTLLSAILNQNPRFSASMRSPMDDLISRVIRGSSDEFRTVLTDEMITHILRGMFDSYYANSNDVVFDTSRGWAFRSTLTKALFPDSKIILCVRNIRDILNSFEKLHRKNPIRLTKMYDEQVGATVMNRTTALMGEGGVVATAYQGVIEYLAATPTADVHLIEYDILANSPKTEIRRLYNYLGEDHFEHDFDNVETSHSEYDMNLNTPGLHTTRKKVSLFKQEYVLPEGIVNQFTTDPPMEFWRK